MKLSDGLFLESCRTGRGGVPRRVEFEDRIVDNMCMQLVQKPDLYDVLVLPNLYGDIVSDLCAGLVGGLGVAPGANIGTEGGRLRAGPRLGPKYAGLNRANPTALILSGVLMLRTSASSRPRNGSRRRPRAVIAEGKRTTPDLGGEGGTREFADAIVERLASGDGLDASPRLSPDDGRPEDARPARPRSSSRPAPPRAGSAGPIATTPGGSRRPSRAPLHGLRDVPVRQRHPLDADLRDGLPG
jgi:hypothetical protein